MVLAQEKRKGLAWVMCILGGELNRRGGLDGRGEFGTVGHDTGVFAGEGEVDEGCHEIIWYSIIVKGGAGWRVAID